MAEYIFTFGPGQVSPISGLSQGRYGQGRYVRIEAADFLAARARMAELYGTEWSMQYNADEGNDPAGIERFGLVEIDVLEVNTVEGQRRIEFEVKRSAPSALKGNRSS